MFSLWCDCDIRRSHNINAGRESFRQERIAHERLVKKQKSDRKIGGNAIKRELVKQYGVDGDVFVNPF